MPNYFQLVKKGEKEPTALNAIDEELCAHLGVGVHPKKWVRGWYNAIGFALALGKSWEQMREIFLPPIPAGNVMNDEEKADREEMAKIIDYLEEHYTSSAWYRPR